MSWRTVYISNHCKLEYRMGYMVIRTKDIKRIHISEIGTLLIDSTAVSMTTSLINELTKAKVKLVFCDEAHNPSSELVPYYGAYDSSRALRKQLSWSDDIKGKLWQSIVRDKILKQSQLLSRHNLLPESELLKSYIPFVEPGDESNREGHAAKVYFNIIFGEDFVRHEDGIINAALDYGYSLLLSSFNKEVVAKGRLTQLGIWHDNTFNYFNLSSDLMEAFRPLIDNYILNMNFEDGCELTFEDKINLVGVLESEIMINGRIFKLPDAIKLYVNEIMKVLDKEDMAYMPVITYG